MFKFIIFFILISFSSLANSIKIGSDTGFNLPRFVSLKSNDVNLRVGSSINFPIILKYTNINLPLEIIEEYNSWRKIKDFNNNEGWLHKSLITGVRFAIINQNNNNNLIIYSKPNGHAIGEIGNFNIVKINTCLVDWCKIKYKNRKGWVSKNELWGIYKNEKINVSFLQPLLNQIWKINIFN